MEKKYNYTENVGNVKKGDYNWYKHCANTLDILEVIGLSRVQFDNYVITHIVDMLVLGDKLVLLNFLYYYAERMNHTLDEFEEAVKRVFDTKILKNKGIFIQDKGNTELYVRGNTNWIEAEKTDYVEMKDVLQTKISSTIPNLNTILGFMIEFKKSYFVFKTKNLELKRHRGARCDQASKKDTVKTIQGIIQDKIEKDSILAMNNIELCIFMEFVLRYYNEIKKQDKVWFLEPEYSQLLKIEDYTKKN